MRLVWEPNKRVRCQEGVDHEYCLVSTRCPWNVRMVDRDSQKTVVCHGHVIGFRFLGYFLI